MKYPQLVSMPSAISDWLEEQLEARGIDAVVYTRYVLSLLYRDPVDIICDQEQDVRPSGGGGGRKRLCRASYYHHWAHADAERLQRSAAVECLKSASDQKCGIESLVDELCAKLKDLEQRKVSSDVLVPDVEHLHQQQTPSRAQHNYYHHARSKPVRIPRKHNADRDSARRYYAAFPALSSTTSTGDNTNTHLVQIVPKWLGSPKRRKPPAPQVMEIKPSPTLSKYRKHSSSNKPKSGAKSVPVHHRQMASSPPMLLGRRELEGRQVIDDEIEDDEMYDLPLLDDIRELLDSASSPSPMMDDGKMLQAAPASPAKFLPCGTNIISSIWSASEGGGDCDFALDVKFGGIAIDASAMWSTSAMWSDRDFERDNRVAQSLLKLNHARDASGFIEVQPRRGHFAGESSMLESAKRHLAPSVVESSQTDIDDDGKDDLLHSARSHFKPINESSSHQADEGHRQPKYVDGTTFAIHANLDVVAFERSESGTMYLQEVVGGGGGGGHGNDVIGGNNGSKRYLEFKREHAFNVKFNVNPNDKGCQTDDSSTMDEEPQPQTLQAPVDQRPDSTMAELFPEGDKCANCASSITTSTNSENIWNGEICMGCLQLSTFATERITPLQERQLREDIQEDGERLLSDLSSLQQSYMVDQEIVEEAVPYIGDLLAAEASYDIAALICGPPLASYGGDVGGVDVGEVGGVGVRKLRVPIHSASFSFATRLQQDCLLKMATIPTLRSVTL